MIAPWPTRQTLLSQDRAVAKWRERVIGADETKHRRLRVCIEVC